MGNVIALRANETTTFAGGGLALFKKGYPPLPIRPGTKSPGLRGWSTLEITEDLIQQWISQGRGGWGIGIRGEHTPGIDLDVSDVEILGKLTDWCDAEIGVTGRRTGRPPRVLLPYRTDAPFGKMSSGKFEAPDGSTHQIEILGKGCQYVAYAIHPQTGKPYTWEGLDPLVMPAELLPTLTPEKAKALIEYFESIVPASWKPVSKSSAKTAAEHEGNPKKTASLRRLKSAMECIPNEERDWGNWKKFMMALWAAVGEEKSEGFEIVDEWSAKHPKYDPDRTASEWSNITEVHSLGAGTIFEEASKSHWVDPGEETSDDFDVVEIIDDEQPGESASTPAESPAILPEKPARFTFETIDDLMCLPPVKWLAKPWFPENTVGILYGKWGSLKTFVIFDLAMHLANGAAHWHGAELPGEPVKVLIIAREGHQGFVQRIEAFKRHYGLAENTRNVVFMRAPVNFMNDADFKLFENTLRERKDGFRLVLIDTVARVIPGTDLSSPEHITLFTERCARVADATGATTIGVHHENKSSGIMGSVYFEANSDFVFRIERQDSPSSGYAEAKITCTKMKDGEDGWSRRLRFDQIKWGDAVDPESSLVLTGVMAPKGVEGDGDVPPRAMFFMSSLEDAVERGGGRGVTWQQWTEAQYLAIDPGWNASGEVPAHCSKSALNRHKNALINKGLVREQPDGLFVPATAE